MPHDFRLTYAGPQDNLVRFLNPGSDEPFYYATEAERYISIAGKGTITIRYQSQMKNSSNGVFYKFLVETKPIRPVKQDDKHHTYVFEPHKEVSVEVFPHSNNMRLVIQYKLDDSFYGNPGTAKKVWDHVSFEFENDSLILVKSDSRTDTDNPDWTDKKFLDAVRKGKDDYRVRSPGTDEAKIIYKGVFGNGPISVDEFVKRELEGKNLKRYFG